MTTRSSSSGAPYQLSIDGFAADHFRVHALEGNETISEAWWFDVVVTAPVGDDVEQGALTARATLIFDLHESQRAFYGIVAAVRLVEAHALNRTVKYVVRVVPRLWLLRRKTRTRIFQRMRVPDIVSSVLLEAGITTRWQLVRAYPEREYCTQYEETDYRFVRRLLAESGIYFYFFGGGPVSGAAFAVDAAVGVAASVGSSIAGSVGGSAIGGLVGEAAQMGETLIPGDTVVGADDAPCYPPVGGDDAGALAASTAAAMAPAIGDALGIGGIGGAALGAASAVAGTVIADVTEGGRSGPVLHFLTNDEASVSTHDRVLRFTLHNTVRSTGAAFRDYDPVRPMTRLQSVAVSTQPFPPSPFELAAEAAAAAESLATAAGGMLGGAAGGALGAVSDAISTADSVVNQVGAALGQKVPYEVYDHHSPFLFPKWAFGSDEAPRILRQKRRRASIAEGEGGCSDLSPAHRFTLDDHPAPQLDGDYVVTTVVHHGETHPTSAGAWRVYRNTFECAPAQMPYVPPRPKRKSVQVSLTATVVGPPGAEIYVDPMGQIRVQFHWDREGTYDEKSSCWIRTMQPWGGAAYGHQFIPRVGMEVVVVFEGGDPDKPMVLGSLYNGTHPPPFALPRDQTRSGIRTSSSPGGRGYNELSFEDRAGAEQILVVAQRDMDEKVAHDHTRRVGRNEQVAVARDRTLTVGGTLTEAVTINATQSIGGARVLEVKGTERESVVGDATKVAKGQMTLIVNGEYGVTVGTPEQDAAATLDVHGDYKIGASKDVRLVATRSIQLTCGDSVLEITPDEIKLTAKALTLVGTKSVSMEGKGPALHLTDEAVMTSKTITLKGSQGSLQIDKDTKIKGQLIKLNCDDVSETDDDPPPSVPPKTFQVHLHDDFHKPYANKQYRLLVEGKELNGTTDGDGLVEQDVSPEAASADLTLWLDQPDKDPRLQWHLTLADLPPMDTPHGVRRRLANLGYYRVVPGQTGGAMAAAIAAFQKDQGMDPTGVADAAMLSKLKEIHKQ